MSNGSEVDQSPEEIQNISFAGFLSNIPSYTLRGVDDLHERTLNDMPRLITPDITLHCDSDDCQGNRRFVAISGANTPLAHENFVFVKYVCRNCQKTFKTFAIYIIHDENIKFYALKLGEFPSFGPPLPSRLKSLIGSDYDYFRRGFRSENQGLGIGAFAYYRRVVENQKGHLFREIAKVARRLGAAPEQINLLEEAAQESQFKKAVDSAKDAIPTVLLSDGHNPMVLLHSALSQGLHAGSEAECLELASSIRIVLTDLAERISTALKEETELRNAISKLMHKRGSMTEPNVSE